MHLILAVQILVSFNAERCLIGNPSTLMDLLGAAAANQSWWLSTNPLSG
jgi:hypothetical protein